MNIEFNSAMLLIAVALMVISASGTWYGVVHIKRMLNDFGRKITINQKSYLFEGSEMPDATSSKSDSN